MGRTFLRGFLTAFFVAAFAACLSGCLGKPSGRPDTASLTGPRTERDCLVRAMYFESNRSSYDGLIAVGTVVMNRVDARRFPNTICGVVSQDRQFAPGVLTRPLDPRQIGPAERAANAILRGERYAPVGRAMHFHMASFKNPYPAKYVAVAGGNAFYLKPGQRFRETVIASNKPAAVTASAATPAVATPAVASADAGASQGDGFLEKLYSRVALTPAAAAPCETVTAGFGSTPLSCESEMEGR
jgi:spore germination cell wall hydrolase CwlJ-like protein